jgi:hypothetical protein
VTSSLMGMSESLTGRYFADDVLRDFPDDA